MIRKGIGVSPGIAVGRALVLEGHRLAMPRRELRDDEVEAEVARLADAVETAKRQIEELRKRMKDSLREELSHILDAHLLMLDDDALVGEAVRHIRRDRLNAEWAVGEVIGHLSGQFEQSGDEYFRERARDVQDVGDRVQQVLSGTAAAIAVPESPEGHIVVAHDPLPSETAQLDRSRVIGIALDAGGRTSHTGIIAKSLEIPAVIGLGTITREVRNGDLLILDGDKGEVITGPSKTLVREYLNKREAHRLHERELLKDRDLPAITQDGYKIFLQANLDFPGELESAERHGAEGVGLFRSEFLYLDALVGGPPGEDEQYEVYREMAARLHPRSVIVRTIDFGGGKVRPASEEPTERNPIMGLRAIRYCLAHRDLFRTQLRALLRASVHGRLKIMFPMVTSVTELRIARSVLEEAKAELRDQDVPFNPDVQVGIMIEVPAAAAIADLLAREVNFFSIGTNDLIQFFLAIDRDNAAVSYLYEPVHPGVLRTIKFVVDAAHRAGIRVGMCGEMAAEPAYVLLLVGLGLDELSMNPGSIPLVKKIIRAVARKEAARIAERALQLPTAQDVEEFVLETLVSKFPHGYLLL